MSQEVEKLYGIVLFVSSMSFVFFNRSNLSQKRTSHTDKKEHNKYNMQGSIALTTTDQQHKAPPSQDIKINQLAKQKCIKIKKQDRKLHHDEENSSTCDSGCIIEKEQKTATILSGKDAIMSLLLGALCPTSPLSDPIMFYKWVMKTIQVKSQSANEFQKRQSIVEITYLNQEEISEVEECEVNALLAWQRHPKYAIRRELEERSEVIRKALANMKGQFERKLSEAKLASLQKIFQENEFLLKEIELQLGPLNIIEEYQAYVIASDKHVQLLSELGISVAEKELETLQHTSGVRKSKGGFRFEDEAAKIIQEKLLVKIAKQHQVPVSSLIVVRNMTFQMASFEGSPGEIDMMVCLRVNTLQDEDKSGVYEKAKEEVKKETKMNCKDEQNNAVKKNKTKNKNKNINVDVLVLAVIEVKKNCDDVGKSFLSYQATLNWLCGLEDTYDADMWKSKRYPRGHFVKPFVYPLPLTATGVENKETTSENIVFTRKSFQYIKENRRHLSIPQILPGHFTKTGTCPEIGREEVQDSITATVAEDEQLFFCQDMYYVTKWARMENINSRDMQILMHRLANHKNIYKTRQLLKMQHCDDDGGDSGDSDSDGNALQVKLEHYIEELRLNIVENSKFQNSFCTGDLLTLFLQDGCFDQLYCVEEKKNKS